MTQIAASSSQNILILGIGNPLMGDDGAGSRVVEMLTSNQLPANIRIKEAGLPGWELANWLEKESDVIIVDAIEMNADPGTWRRFSPDEVRFLIEKNTLSLHEPGLACGLALAEALNMLPEKLTIYGVQPARLTPGAGISPEVEETLPLLVTSLLHEIGRKQ